MALPDIFGRQSTKAKQSATASANVDSQKGAQASEPNIKPGRPKKNATITSDKATPREGAKTPGQKRKPGRPKKDRGPSTDLENPTKKPKIDLKHSSEKSVPQKFPEDKTSSTSDTNISTICIGTANPLQDNSPRPSSEKRHTSQQNSIHFGGGSPDDDFPELSDIGLEASKRASKATTKVGVMDRSTGD